jgi:hypothetical protein
MQVVEVERRLSDEQLQRIVWRRWTEDHEEVVAVIKTLSDGTSDEPQIDSNAVLRWIIMEDQMELLEELVGAQQFVGLRDAVGTFENALLRDGCSLRMAQRILRDGNVWRDYNFSFMVSQILESESLTGWAPWFQRYKIPLLELILARVPAVLPLNNVNSIPRTMQDVIPGVDPRILELVLMHPLTRNSIRTNQGNIRSGHVVFQRLEQGRGRIAVLFTESFAGRSNLPFDMISIILSFIEPYHERVLEKVFTMIRERRTTNQAPPSSPMITWDVVDQEQLLADQQGDDF